MLAEMLLLLLKHFKCILRLPLKRSKRFRNKAWNAYCNRGRTAFIMIWICEICLDHRLGGIRYSLDILKCFCRKSGHKIELYYVSTCVKCHVHGSENILLGHILIYNVTEPLCTCFRCKCQRWWTYGTYLIHKLFREAVNTQRRKREGYHIFICPW